MKITVLINDIALDGFEHEHGLSYLIETKKDRLLFDTGQSDLFVRNAMKLGIDLAEVEHVIISHGHYDHGGGMKYFIKLNSRADILIRENAFGNLYSEQEGNRLKPIGIDRNDYPAKRLILTGEEHVIDKDLFLFSGVTGRKLFPSRNQSLLQETGKEIMPDKFDHEQNLVVKEGDKTLLVVGCAHNGVINILETLASRYGIVPDHVLGGLHLYSASTRTMESEENMLELAKYLKKHPASFYTGHCTGMEPYMYLKGILKDKISYLKAGSILEI